MSSTVLHFTSPWDGMGWDGIVLFCSTTIPLDPCVFVGFWGGEGGKWGWVWIIEDWGEVKKMEGREVVL